MVLGCRELYGWNDAVSELDEIHTLYVYLKTINHFVITEDVISTIQDCLGLKISFFSYGPTRELFRWNDAVSELDEIRTLCVYGKTISHFVITDDVISSLRDCLGAQNVVFRFGAGARTFRVE